MKFVLNCEVKLPKTYDKLAEINASPNNVVSKFGVPPLHGDQYKVTGEYVFVGDNQSVFMLTDWKETLQYWNDWEVCDRKTLTVEEFWRSMEKTSFLIWGIETPRLFIEWIERALRGDEEIKDRRSVIYL